MGGGGEIIAGCGLSGWLRQNYVLSWLVVDGGGKIMTDRGWSHDLVMPVNIFVFISWLFSHKVFIHIQHFLAVVRKKLQTLTIKRRSKVQENNMSCERALNFDQWKTFSENYKPMRVWLWFVYKFTENYCRLRLFSEFIQTQKRYPTSLDKIRILTWKLLVISS